MMNSILDSFRIPESWSALTPKEGEDRTIEKNYWPISLLSNNLKNI